MRVSNCRRWSPRPIDAGSAGDELHDLDRWLARHGSALAAAGIATDVGRGPEVDGRPSATWLSFDTSASHGRVVLWSTGRCQVHVSANDSTSLCKTDETITTTAQLDAAMSTVTGHLGLLPIG